jgi:hypothetical protein
VNPVVAGLGSALKGGASMVGGAMRQGANVAGGLAGALATQIAADQLSDRLFTPVVPGAAASAAPAGKGFLTTSSEQLSIYQWVVSENQRRRQLNFLSQFVGGEELPELDPASVIAAYSQTKERELGGATERKIQEIEAQRGFDVQIAEIARQAEIEKQRLASEAQVSAQRERSLGDVQRQRVESSYGTASNLLNQAIKDVVARERYENNTALAELARAI